MIAALARDGAIPAEEGPAEPDGAGERSMARLNQLTKNAFMPRAVFLRSARAVTQARARRH